MPPVRGAAVRTSARKRPRTTRSARPCARLCASSRKFIASASPCSSMASSRARPTARSRGRSARRRISTGSRSSFAAAIGFDEKRGDHVEVVNMRFVDEALPTADEARGLFGLPIEKSDVMRLAQTLLFGIVGIVGLLLVLRPMVMRLTALRRRTGTRQCGDPMRRWRVRRPRVGLPRPARRAPPLRPCRIRADAGGVQPESAGDAVATSTGSCGRRRSGESLISSRSIPRRAFRSCAPGCSRSAS